LLRQRLGLSRALPDRDREPTVSITCSRHTKGSTRSPAFQKLPQPVRQ